MSKLFYKAIIHDIENKNCLDAEVEKLIFDDSCHFFKISELFRTRVSKVTTIPKPEKIAPATKYGGKIVVCQPGSMETAKSKDTIVCTDKTSGVESAANNMYTIS